jgi:hypothetical protein
MYRFEIGTDVCRALSCVLFKIKDGSKSSLITSLIDCDCFLKSLNVFLKKSISSMREVVAFTGVETAFKAFEFSTNHLVL